MNVAWYLSRSAGLVAYLILFLTVVLGISIRTKGLDRLVARWKVTDIHIFLSLLTLGFVAVHAGVLLWDGFVGYSLLDLLVPFATSYRSFWTGIGITMMYLLVVVAVSFPVRRWIGYRAWRTLHYSTFLAYVGALGHGIFTGTDSRTAWAQLLYISTAAIVVGLVLYRIYVWRRREKTVWTPVLEAGSVRRAPASAIYAAREAAARLNVVENRATTIGFGALFLAGVLFFAAALGPFKWFNQDHGNGGGDDIAAAQPAAPDQGSTNSGQTANNQPPTQPANPQAQAPGASGFSDTFSGTTTQTQSGSTVKLTMVGNGTGQKSVAFDVELQLAQSERRTQAISNSFQLKDDAGAMLCAGEVQQLTNQGLVATCQGQGSFSGQQLTLQMLFDQGLASQVTGTLDATVEG